MSSFEVVIPQDAHRPAWTSRSLMNNAAVTSCPPVGSPKCRVRFFDGKPLQCWCAINGDICDMLLAGQKFTLEEVQRG